MLTPTAKFQCVQLTVCVSLSALANTVAVSPPATVVSQAVFFAVFHAFLQPMAAFSYIGKAAGDVSSSQMPLRGSKKECI
ncbi:hypothetical protein [Collimonas humicola]|uniref:hypothetical protein n=1 Tax=Collimonas humicola TaxID=2825886 RepID=UPI001B8BD9F0|nr:hypothetical protein [Collimonas humicola]